MLICVFLIGVDMEVISRFADMKGCFVENNGEYYAIRDTMRFDANKWHQIRKLLKLRNIEATNHKVELNFHDAFKVYNSRLDNKPTEILEFYENIVRNLGSKLMDPNEGSIMFNSEITSFENMLGKTVKDKYGTWKLSKVIGFGSYCVAFKAELISPSLQGISRYLKGKKTRVAKFTKASNIQLYLRSFVTHNDEFEPQFMAKNGHIKLKPQSKLCRQLEVEQARINQMAELNSNLIYRGGIMEDFAEGKTLDQWLMDDCNNETKKIEIIIKLIQKVHRLHKLGITHNDLNNHSNIIIDGNMNVQIIDFGSSKKNTPRLNEILQHDRMAELEFKKGKFECKSKIDNDFNKDIKEVNQLACEKLGFAETEIFTSDIEESMKLVVTALARNTLEESKDRTPSKYTALRAENDDIFWGLIDKFLKKTKRQSIKKKIKEIKEIKAKFINNSNKTNYFIIAIALICKLAIAEGLLQFFDSNLAINKGYTQILIHSLLIVSALGLFAFTANNFFNRGKKINYCRTPSTPKSHVRHSSNIFRSSPGSIVFSSSDEDSINAHPTLIIADDTSSDEFDSEESLAV